MRNKRTMCIVPLIIVSIIFFPTKAMAWETPYLSDPNIELASKDEKEYKLYGIAIDYADDPWLVNMSVSRKDMTEGNTVHKGLDVNKSRIEYKDTAPFEDVNDTTVSYYRKVVRFLNANEKGGFSICSGAYIGKGVILTAAHCLADVKRITDDEGNLLGVVRRFRTIENIAPGRNGSLYPYGTSNDNLYGLTISTYINEDYYNNPIDQNDWGIIYIKGDTMVQNTGWFGFTTDSNTGAVKAIGYPDRGNGTTKMAYSVGPVLSHDNNIARFEVSMLAGMSGGPILDYNNMSNDPIVGIVQGSDQKKVCDDTENEKCWKDISSNGRMIGKSEYNYLYQIADNKFTVVNR